MTNMKCTTKQILSIIEIVCITAQFDCSLSNCSLFLGFEYFDAEYFSDMDILARIISRIWIFSLALHLSINCL